MIHPAALIAPPGGPKISHEITPPTSEPPIPNRAVASQVIDCLPGMRNRAIAPTIKPKTSQLITLQIADMLHPSTERNDHSSLFGLTANSRSLPFNERAA